MNLALTLINPNLNREEDILGVLWKPEFEPSEELNPFKNVHVTLLSFVGENRFPTGELVKFTRLLY